MGHTIGICGIIVAALGVYVGGQGRPADAASAAVVAQIRADLANATTKADAAQADLTKAQSALATANRRVTELTASAAAITAERDQLALDLAKGVLDLSELPRTRADLKSATTKLADVEKRLTFVTADRDRALAELTKAAKVATALTYANARIAELERANAAVIAARDKAAADLDRSQTPPATPVAAKPTSNCTSPTGKAGFLVSKVCYEPDATRLRVEERDFKDLSTVAGLSNLETLVLQFTQVSDLGPIAGLKELWLVSIGQNRIRDLTPLAALPKLKSLHMMFDNSIDLKEVAKLQNVEWLTLRGSAYTDLTALANLPKLETLTTPDGKKHKGREAVLAAIRSWPTN